MRQLRDAIRQHAHVYKSDELSALNELLTNVGRWHRLLESVSADLAELPEERRQKKAPGVLAIITTGEPPLEYRMDRVQTLDGLITELDNIVSTKDDTRFGTVHDRLTLWRERSTSFLREQVTTKAATDFCRLEPDVP